MLNMKMLTDILQRINSHFEADYHSLENRIEHIEQIMNELEQVKTALQMKLLDHIEKDEEHDDHHDEGTNQSDS